VQEQLIVELYSK